MTLCCGAGEIAAPDLPSDATLRYAAWVDGEAAGVVQHCVPAAFETVDSFGVLDLVPSAKASVLFAGPRWMVFDWQGAF